MAEQRFPRHTMHWSDDPDNPRIHTGTVEDCEKCRDSS